MNSELFIFLISDIGYNMLQPLRLSFHIFEKKRVFKRILYLLSIVCGRLAEDEVSA